MSDYIKRENIAKYAGGLFRNETDEKPIGYLMSEYQINSIPSEDVAPVRHGHWIDKGDGAECSICGSFWEYAGTLDKNRIDRIFRYCETCGTRMDEDGGEDE